jgi:hypothetical protein
MDADMHTGVSVDGEASIETTGQGNDESSAMNATEAPISNRQPSLPYASERTNSISTAVNDFNLHMSMSLFDQTIPLPSGSLAPSGSDPLTNFFSNTIPLEPVPTRQTQWMPDFTFGPASEPIDIPAFLTSVQEALGMEHSLQQTGGDFRSWVCPEHVAGWSELQALGSEEIKMLQEACRSVSVLLFSRKHPLYEGHVCLI